MHAAPLSVVEHNASASTMAYRAPETTMTLSATTPLVHAAAMEENGLDSDEIKLNYSWSEAVSALRGNNNDLIEAILCFEKEETVTQAVNSDIIETSEKRALRISPFVDTPEIQTLQCTEVLDTAPDLGKAPAERTLSIPLADYEGAAIEELSKTMAEGFSTVLDKVIENLDKSDGISAVIDKYFEKSDEPDNNLWSDEYVSGTWASEKGESKIFMDSITNRLSFMDFVNDSGYLHGWLDRRGDGWQARLLFYDMDENYWYSDSGGEEPEYVGDIRVCLLSGKTIETQIKLSDDSEWQPPVLQHSDASNKCDW